MGDEGVIATKATLRGKGETGIPKGGGLAFFGIENDKKARIIIRYIAGT